MNQPIYTKLMNVNHHLQHELKAQCAGRQVLFSENWNDDGMFCPILYNKRALFKPMKYRAFMLQIQTADFIFIGCKH